MRRIVTYLIVLGIIQLCARSFLDVNKTDTIIQSAQAETKSTFVPYPENRVHRAGTFWLNMTNCGYFGNFIGSDEQMSDPCTQKPAPSGEMPGGSGINYIWVSSLLFGGYLDSSNVNINSIEAIQFQGPLVSTAFEGWKGLNGYIDTPRELWPVDFTDDPSGTSYGKIVETSNTAGKRSCLFEDVYDPAATAEEQFNINYSDKYIDRTYTGMDDYDRRDHIPLGIEVKQKSYAWSYPFAKKYIIIDYTLYNRNKDRKDIYDFFMGMYFDCDIGNNNYGGAAYWPTAFDDIGGYIESWDNYVDPATGENESVNLNLAWVADNDGRPFYYNQETGDMIEYGAGYPLDDALGIATVRVLRNPNPDLSYSYNVYVANSFNESNDWSPRWQKDLHAGWQYDLSSAQKGYDDSNSDSLYNDYGEFMFGGRTEGRPIGDKGKYMVMSNNELDYNQTSIREVYLGMNTQADGTPIRQAEKWQRWTTPSDIGGDGFSPDISDGNIVEMNNLANGEDTKFIISFGPLGMESLVNVACDLNGDNEPDSVITNKKIWRFAYGDSLKLTLAFIVNDNFHTSMMQAPHYQDSSVVSLSDGLDISLYNQGWYDALYNVKWAERLYDIPMWDTPVKKWGVEKTDGWFGEDIGKDGVLADHIGELCWWSNSVYHNPDEGERDYELSVFENPVTDIYGFTSDSEDNLLPFGNKDGAGNFGITGSETSGEGYGYMVKYPKPDGVFPQGTWVRYGFDNGELDMGDGVPDFTAPPPPPSPKLKVSYADKDVIVEWSSHELYNEGGITGASGSEHFRDPFTGKVDFEGYQIMFSQTQYAQDYVELYSIDKCNFTYENIEIKGQYLTDPISADTLYAHPELYPATKVVNGKIWQLIPFGENRSLYENYEKSELFSYSVTSDSSMAEEVGIIYNYKFVFKNKLPADEFYIAVTASDFGDSKSQTPPLRSSPLNNGRSVIPAKISGKDEVIVVPNPYRGDVDYESMGWENTDGSHHWSEHDRKIVFMNLPLRCVIRIYTLAGDLVKTITHNGNAKENTLWQYGEYGAYWNLINDNRQACLSGLYLFSVQDVDKKKDDFVGKFVIIK
jgi:hypothetical protein